MRMRVTVTFEYDADPKNYPSSDPGAMAKIDQEAYENASNLVDAICADDYSVKVEPV